MSRHLDGSPKPVDPLWFRMGQSLRVRCACGRAAELPLGKLARRHRLPGHLKLYELVGRLRCTGCGARPPAAVDVA